MRTRYYWHVHHDTLLEPLEGTVENRIAYIRDCKPKHEVSTRLRLMKPVKGALPKTLYKSWSTVRKASVSFQDAWEGFDNKLRATFNDAWMAYNKVLRESREVIEALHKQECPDCPWNGKTIFPPKKG